MKIIFIILLINIMSLHAPERDLEVVRQERTALEAAELRNCKRIFALVGWGAASAVDAVIFGASDEQSAARFCLITGGFALATGRALYLENKRSQLYPDPVQPLHNALTEYFAITS